MASASDVEKAEQRGYSKGYAAGRRRAETDMQVARRSMVSAHQRIVQSILAKAQGKGLNKPGSLAFLLECLAKELDKAAGNGRIAEWEKAGHSLIEYIAYERAALATSGAQPASDSLQTLAVDPKA